MLKVKEEKNLTYNFRITFIISDRSAQLALCMQLQPCTRAHTYARTLTRNQAESLLISSHSHHSAEKKLVSQALLFLQRPVATLKVSAASKPPGCLLASLSPLTHSLSYLRSHFPSPSLFSLSLTLSPALLSDLSFFPLSSVYTMHINYSEAVYWSLRLIQSELGSALMGSRCTCYRLQRTLEEAGE